MEEQEVPQIQTQEADQLAQVREWFEENEPNLRLDDIGPNFKTRSEELVLPFFEKNPDWKKFHHYYFSDGREVFEVNLKNESIYYPQKKGNSSKSKEVEYIQNILFEKKSI